jgi:hypothetical protein
VHWSGLQAIVAFSGFQHGYFTEMDALWLLQYTFLLLSNNVFPGHENLCKESNSTVSWQEQFNFSI